MNKLLLHSPKNNLDLSGKVRPGMKTESLLQSSRLEEQFAGAVCSMDIAKISKLMDAMPEFEDKSKAEFLDDLVQSFKEFRHNGDTRLACYPGRCGGVGCGNKGCKGYRFEGNATGNYFELIFEMKDHKIVDLTQCFGFECPVALKEGGVIQFLSKDENPF